ncbi:hypothetical protein BJ742DRAFT_852592 [Cladochytrium replicatum]|nr:hypothetical protein BJ742DRAFT_852592 [Cladochytrium replicatum]
MFPQSSPVEDVLVAEKNKQPSPGELLASISLDECTLSDSGRVHLRALSNIARALIAKQEGNFGEPRQVPFTSLVTALMGLLNKHEHLSDDKSALEQMITKITKSNAQLRSDLLRFQTDIKKPVLDQLPQQAHERDRWTRFSGVLEQKRREYESRHEDLLNALAELTPIPQSPATPSPFLATPQCRRGIMEEEGPIDVSSLWERLKRLDESVAKLENMERELAGFEGLPPNLKLARLQLAEKQQQLKILVHEKTRVLQSISNSFQ